MPNNNMRHSRRGNEVPVKDTGIPGPPDVVNCRSNGQSSRIFEDTTPIARSGASNPRKGLGNGGNRGRELESGLHLAPNDIRVGALEKEVRCDSNSASHKRHP